MLNSLLYFVLAIVTVSSQSFGMDNVAVTSKDISRLTADIAESVIHVANEAISNHNRFFLGLAGGSMAKLLQDLSTCNIKTDFEKWYIIFVDERYVPLDSPDCNYLSFVSLLGKLKISQDNVLKLDYDEQGGVEIAAERYGTSFSNLVPDNSLDLLLLGMGPDGHIASLFPYFTSAGLHVPPPEAADTEQTCRPPYISIDASPKPPPNRITMTLETINKSKKIYFAITGGAKADTIAQFLTDFEVKEVPGVETKDTEDIVGLCRYVKDTTLPASLIDISATNLRFYLDKDAFASIKYR